MIPLTWDEVATAIYRVILGAEIAVCLVALSQIVEMALR